MLSFQLNDHLTYLLLEKGTWYLGTCTQGSVQYGTSLHKVYNHECCQDNFWDIKLSCRGVYRADWQITGYVGWSGGYIEIDGKRYCEGEFEYETHTITVETARNKKSEKTYNSHPDGPYRLKLNHLTKLK